MLALQKRVPDVQFYGIGGETMIAAGFKSLFDISDLAVMGILEVAPRLPLILRRIREVAADIERTKPDVLITVDSWGFVHQLLNRLKKKHINVTKIHYVAPQVWVWKRGRAKTAAHLFDHLMTLLPHEAPSFEKYGLPCTFVGHPVIENTADIIVDTAEFHSRYNIPQDSTVVCVLPGSRKGEIARLAPIFKKIIAEVAFRFPNIFVILPSVEKRAAQVSAAFADLPVPHTIVVGQMERYAAFCASVFALAASGTVSLELAACKVPHVVAYRFGAVSNLLAEVFLRPHTPSVTLVNILQGKTIIPECMIKDCTVDYILPRVLALMSDADARDRQVADFQKSLLRLCPPDMLPSEKAAEVVLKMINNGIAS
jgi:lipid-A-disaccharide synthase